ncbi:MAG TPA: hypothetical protein VFW25_05570 [Silvibacterium sp.]|nr:hypothetical protein [Silvibacterium sp.]
MKVPRLFAAAGLIAALPLFTAATALTAFGQPSDDAQAKTVITVLSKNTEQVPQVTQRDLKIQVNGQSVQADNVTPLRGEHAGLELVILIDSGARTSLGRQLGEIAGFVRTLPPTTKVAIAYMVNGRAAFQQPFTTDRNAALRALHIPGGTSGGSASPYFCISDLAKNWPSNNLSDRREVIAITDGIDPYEVRFDPEDPYVNAAIHDSIRAGMIVDALYWHDTGVASHVGFLASGGQNLLMLLTNATGGNLYYQGLGNPVSFTPFFDELNRKLQNQYELGFVVPAKSKPQIETLKVKLEMPGVKLYSARLVAIPAR